MLENKRARTAKYFPFRNNQLLITIVFAGLQFLLFFYHVPSAKTACNASSGKVILTMSMQTVDSFGYSLQMYSHGSFVHAVSSHPLRTRILPPIVGG